MGGAYYYPGNTTPTAEWNTWVDPDAAKEAWQRFYFKGELPEAMGQAPATHANKRRLKTPRVG